ncbi:hypothetical protein Taro_052230, partial [Colocasia esculenta]|nr:hypothetical protein [Colocasia esculenta]
DKPEKEAGTTGCSGATRPAPARSAPGCGCLHLDLLLPRKQAIRGVPAFPSPPRAWRRTRLVSLCREIRGGVPTATAVSLTSHSPLFFGHVFLPWGSNHSVLPTAVSAHRGVVLPICPHGVAACLGCSVRGWLRLALELLILRNAPLCFSPIGSWFRMR